MKLDEVRTSVSLLPTIMDISDELLIISELMNIQLNELNENKEDFYFIVKQIELSHTDSGFIELTKENEGEFIKFYKWLKKVRGELNLELNDNLIENFNLTFEEVKKLMS